MQESVNLIAYMKVVYLLYGPCNMVHVQFEC